jgi:outer membrane protein TolC
MNDTYRCHEVRMTRFLYAALALVLSFPVALAQNAPAIGQSTILRAVEQTLTLRQAVLRFGQAQAQAQAAGVPWSASVNAGYGWSGNPDATTGEFSGSVTISSSGLWGEQASKRQEAQVALERAERGLVSTRLRLQRQALGLWHQLRRAEQAQVISSSNVVVMTLLDQSAQARLDGGSINALERDLARSNLELAQQDLARAGLRRQQLAAQVLVQLSLASTPLAAWQPLPGPDWNRPLATRDDVFEASAAVASSEQALMLARQTMFPSLSLNAGISGSGGGLALQLNQQLAGNLTYSTPSSRGTGVGTGGHQWNLSISASIPWSPGQYAALPGLEQATNQAREVLQQTLALARLDIDLKRDAIGQAQLLLGQAERSAQLARDRVDYSQTRLQSGIASPLELRRSEVEWLRAIDAAIAAQSNLDNAALDGFEAVGLALPASETAINPQNSGEKP